MGELQKRIEIVCVNVGFDDHYKELMRIVGEMTKEFPEDLLTFLKNIVGFHVNVEPCKMTIESEDAIRLWKWFEKWLK